MYVRREVSLVYRYRTNTGCFIFVVDCTVFKNKKSHSKNNFFFLFQIRFRTDTYLLLRVAKSSTRNANFSSPNFCCSLFSFLSQGLLQNFVEGNELLLVFHCHSVAKLFQPEHIFANRLVFQVRDN